MSETIYDSVIIGGGPAGITATLYLVRAGLNVTFIEKGAVGGQVLSTAEIENYPGFPRAIKGYEMADVFEAQLQKYMFRRLQTNVESLLVQNEDNIHIVQTARGPLKTKTIIIASGASHKELGNPSEIAFKNKGVSYCAVCDGNFYKGQDVAVIGGGNSALEESLYLARIVKHLYIIHRRNEFRATKIYVDKLKQLENVTFLTPTVLEEIKGTNAVEQVVVKNVETNALQTIDVAGVFVFVGIQPSGDFVGNDIKTSEGGFIYTDTEMLTNIPGVYAAGDIREKRSRQVITAAGDGATAALSAIAYLEQLNA